LRNFAITFLSNLSCYDQLLSRVGGHGREVYLIEVRYRMELKQRGPKIGPTRKGEVLVTISIDINPFRSDPCEREAPATSPATTLRSKGRLNLLVVM